MFRPREFLVGESRSCKKRHKKNTSISYFEIPSHQELLSKNNVSPNHGKAKVLRHNDRDTIQDYPYGM